MRDQHIAMLFIVVVILGFAVAALGQDGAHGHGHAEMHDTYRGWVAPDNPGMSCCHGEDCRPTRAYSEPDGTWRAWNGQRWLPIPPGRVMPPDYAGDGRTHLCEKDGEVYCFTPAPPRS